MGWAWDSPSGKGPLSHVVGEGGDGGLGPDHSRKVMGDRFGAQGAASTHGSPQKSHGFIETAKSGPRPGPQGQAPPVNRETQ